MSEQNFLSFLQQVLTMVNPADETSIELGKRALNAVIELALSSRKVSAPVVRMMYVAEGCFDHLIKNADHFIGKPGQYAENEQRRRRLANAIRPSC